MQREQIVRRTWELLAPDLEQFGYELVEVEYGREEPGDVLRLYVDAEDGITIDDCVNVSHFVSPLLDKEDYIPDAYNLEVSSPGIDRPIRKTNDFERFRGERIKLETVAPIGGRKRYTGILDGIEDGLISITVDGEQHAIHIENVKKAKLDR